MIHIYFEKELVSETLEICERPPSRPMGVASEEKCLAYSQDTLVNI